MEELLDISLVCEDRGPVVFVKGEIDVSTASDLEGALKQALEVSPSYLVLDMREVTYIDSTGIRMLMRVYSELRDREGCLCVRNCSDPVRRLMSLLGVHRYLIF